MIYRSLLLRESIAAKVLRIRQVRAEWFDAGSKCFLPPFVPAESYTQGQEICVCQRVSWPWELFLVFFECVHRLRINIVHSSLACAATHHVPAHRRSRGDYAAPNIKIGQWSWEERTICSRLWKLVNSLPCAACAMMFGLHVRRSLNYWLATMFKNCFRAPLTCRCSQCAGNFLGYFFSTCCITAISHLLQSCRSCLQCQPYICPEVKIQEFALIFVNEWLTLQNWHNNAVFFASFTITNLSGILPLSVENLLSQSTYLHLLICVVGCTLL